MFIFNVKVNGNKIFKIFFTIVTILLIFILVFVTYKIFSGASSSTSSCVPNKDIYEISTKNYTNVLKTVHDNIDEYIGMKIKFSGYVHRMIDFNDNQFVLARNMVISSDFQTVIVGFLCECDTAKEFADQTWIEVEGEISKGNYHGDMPILKITSITKIDKPSDEYVYPPDSAFVPTSAIF